MGERFESALAYAVEYGVMCALADTLQRPLEDVQADPFRCGLQASLEEALEWGLRHVMEDDLKTATQEIIQAAQQRAAEFARKEEFPEEVENAVSGLEADDATKQAIKDILLKALDECVDAALATAVDNALHGGPLTLAGGESFIWPVQSPEAYITSTFGSRRRTHGGGGRNHSGIDIVVAKGTPVLAAADGTVTFAGESGSGYGRIIKVDHGGGMETWYAHLNAYSVKEGVPVPTGTKIGEVGRTGRASAYHLHFEVRENGEAVNPEDYLP